MSGGEKQNLPLEPLKTIIFTFTKALRVDSHFVAQKDLVPDCFLPLLKKYSAFNVLSSVKMTQQLAPSGIDGFNSIAPGISLYRPDVSRIATIPSAGNPSLIVLCSWMGALPKHIAKYTAGYQRLFPDAPILLIQSSIGDTFASDAKAMPRLKIACETVLSYKAANKTGAGRILLHVMSNGGSMVAMHMSSLLTKEGHGANCFSRLIFDCAPSRPHVKAGATAVAVGLPKNWLVQFIGTWLLRIWMHAGMFLVWLFGQEDILTRLRRWLNDTNRFDASMARIYLYSKADKLVPWQDVRDHAEEATKNGFKEVKQVVFESAPHCALVMDDPKRYWDTVKSFALE